MKDYMESALEMARQLHESLGDIEEWGIDNGDEMQQVSQMLFVPTRPSRPWLVRPSVSHAFAVCHKMWPYRRDFDAANLSKKFKCKN